MDAFQRHEEHALYARRTNAGHVVARLLLVAQPRRGRRHLLHTIPPTDHGQVPVRPLPVAPRSPRCATAPTDSALETGERPSALIDARRRRVSAGDR